MRIKIKKGFFLRLSEKIDQFIFRTKKQIFKSDLNVIFFSFALLVVFCFLYELPHLLGYLFTPLFDPFWAREIYYPFVFSVASFTLTVVVLLSINTQKTQSGYDFMIHLTSLLFTRKAGDLYILTPNINIGMYRYKEKFDNYVKGIKKAKNRGVKIIFITLGLDKNYLESYEPVNSGEQLNHITEFFKNGEKNKSPMLSYLITKYEHDMNLEDFLSTLATLKELLELSLLIECRMEFAETKIVGFYTNDICYLGKYSDIVSDDRQVSVRGEVVTTKEFRDVVKDLILEGIKEKYKLN